MGIITAPYTVVYPLAVMIASINTVITLRVGLVFIWRSPRNGTYHPTVIGARRAVCTTRGAIFDNHPSDSM